MTTGRIDIGDNITEVEGLPLPPMATEYYDEESGECNITFQACDCKKEMLNYGCSKCLRAVERHIKRLVETGVAKPSVKVEATASDGSKTVSFWRNAPNTVFMHTDGLESVKNNWWSKYLKEIPASIWDATVDKWEFPYAFALYESNGRKKPLQVLWNHELPLVLIYSNRYYAVAPNLWRDVEDIQKEYKESAAGKEKKDVDPDQVDFEVTVETSRQPRRNIISTTKEKRERYGNTRKTERKLRATRPGTDGKITDEVRHGSEQTKNVYHTTRGTKIRR